MALRITSGITPGWIEVDEEVVDEVKEFIKSLLPKGIIFGNLDLKIENMANDIRRKGQVVFKLPTGSSLKLKIRR